MMRKGFGLLVSFVFLLAQGCEPEVEPIKTFVTRKGDHYAYPRVVESLQSRTLAFDAMFNETAIYNFGDPALQSNKNKLLGFSDCNSPHHENSARFAWQWFNERLEIYAYCYSNGERIEKFVGVIDLHEFNHYRIEIGEDHYAFILSNETPVYIQRGNACERGVYYLLWPYFGATFLLPTMFRYSFVYINRSQIHMHKWIILILIIHPQIIYSQGQQRLWELVAFAYMD